MKDVGFGLCMSEFYYLDFYYLALELRCYLKTDLGKFKVFTIIVTFAICAMLWPLWKWFDRRIFMTNGMRQKQE